MKSIQYRKCRDLSGSISRDCPLPRRYPLTDSLVRPCCIELRSNVFAQHASQVVERAKRVSDAFAEEQPKLLPLPPKYIRRAIMAVQAIEKCSSGLVQCATLAGVLAFSNSHGFNRP